MYFCKGYDYRGKADLSKSYRNPERKKWVTTHFTEIFKKALKYKEYMTISFQI